MMSTPALEWRDPLGDMRRIIDAYRRQAHEHDPHTCLICRPRMLTLGERVVSAHNG